MSNNILSSHCFPFKKSVTLYFTSTLNNDTIVKHMAYNTPVVKKSALSNDMEQPMK